MRDPASVVLLAVWLLGGCDTVKRANDAEEAAANCEVLAALSEELCEPDDPTTARVFCAWTPKRIPIGHQPPLSDYQTQPRRALWSCDAAIDVALKQCERGSLAMGHTTIGSPLYTEHGCLPESDPFVEPDCFTWFICE